MMRPRLTLFALVFVLFGCSGMPGNVTVSTSEYDGARTVQVEPAWVSSSLGEGPPFKMGLTWTSRTPSDSVSLLVSVKGAHQFADGKSLKMNLDGQRVQLTPSGRSSIKMSDGVSNDIVYIPPSNWTLKRYRAPVSLVEQMVNASDSIVRVELVRSAVESQFSDGGPTKARPAFEEALRSIREQDTAM